MNEWGCLFVLKCMLSTVVVPLAPIEVSAFIPIGRTWQACSRISGDAMAWLPEERRRIDCGAHGLPGWSAHGPLLMTKAEFERIGKSSKK